MKMLWIINLCIAACFLSLPAQAQQTIFNVPSADLTPKGVVYFEHESQFRAWDPGHYWYGTNYFASGLGKNAEADVTLYNVSVPASDNISLGIGFRAVTPFLKRYPLREFRWTFGSQAIVSLQGKGIGYWGYSHLSGKVPKTKTRFTGGISGGTRQLFGRSTVHFIGGIEQPVTKKMSIIADWYSGKQSLGFFTSGASITLSKSATIFVGYQIPNDSKVSGRQGVTFELAKFF